MKHAKETAPLTQLITDEIRNWIGRATEPVQVEVSRRDIVKYSLATEQRLEKYLRGDEAPPMFLFGADRPLTQIADLGPDGLMRDPLLPELPLKRVMAGGIKQRYFRAVMPGDVLSISRRISNIYEKQGSSGPLIFVDYELNVRATDGELVMQETQSRINR
ncbi:MAG: 3-methylfumaryl-CoA hydratase [Gammaproteobacteria bacterium]|jgi:3-methylfumaryl-CoA hydratase